MKTSFSTLAAVGAATLVTAFCGLMIWTELEARRAVENYIDRHRSLGGHHERTLLACAVAIAAGICVLA
jgi:hypothetical protein